MIPDVDAKEANRADGLTAIEGCVMEALIDAFNDYGELPVEHADEPGEFRYQVAAEKETRWPTSVLPN